MEKNQNSDAKGVRKILVVTKPDELLSFLLVSLPSLSRNKAKSLLTHRQVSVNERIVTHHDSPLAAGDRVAILDRRGPAPFQHSQLRIVYEDEALLVVDKRNGLLSMGTGKEQVHTAYYLLSEHVKRSDPRNRIFIVHRLDRETSGLMLFAKSEQVQEILQRNWKKMVLDRRYVAVAEGHFAESKGTIDAPLSQNRNLCVYVDAAGERAVTHYQVLESGARYSLVELALETGRKNQIRAHLQYMGHPVAGDRKYGAVSNPAGRVCLHARVLHFIHPVTGEQMRFDTRIPRLFEKVVQGGGVRQERETRNR